MRVLDEITLIMLQSLQAFCLNCVTFVFLIFVFHFHSHVSLVLKPDSLSAVLRFRHAIKHLSCYAVLGSNFRSLDLGHWLLPNLVWSFWLLWNLKLTVKLLALIFLYSLFYVLFESLCDIFILAKTLLLN